MRLFVGEPVWKAYNRPADDFEIRQKYVASLQGSWARAVAHNTNHEVEDSYTRTRSLCD